MKDLTIFDKNNKEINLELKQVRKIYILRKKHAHSIIEFYNGEKIDINTQTYFQIQEYLIDNNLIDYFTIFKLPIELQADYTSCNYDLEEYELKYTLLDKFKNKQLIVAIEELSELQKELCKFLRNNVALNSENILEELADVYIMLEQIRIYFDISKENLDKMIKQKLDRTKERLL